MLWIVFVSVLDLIFEISKIMLGFEWIEVICK